MSAPLEITSLSFEIIKLAINDNVNSVVFVGYRLIAGGEINDTQPRVTKAGAMIGGNPDALAVGSPVMKGFRCAFQCLG
jgi:hypothetical protein